MKKSEPPVGREPPEPPEGSIARNAPEPVRLPIAEFLDLHTFRPRDVKDVVADYLDAAHQAGLREVRLIHGRGRGVQRGIVHAALEAHPLVEEFWDAPDAHLGATVARLTR